MKTTTKQFANIDPTHEALVPCPYGPCRKLMGADLRADPHWHILFREDGTLNLDEVAAQLSDYEALMRGCGDIINEFAFGMSGNYKSYTVQAVKEQIQATIDHERECAIDDYLEDNDLPKREVRP